MATSGTTTYTVNRDEVIANALRKCGVLAEGQTATPEQVTNSAQDLNALLKFYATKGWLLFVYEWISFTCVSGDLDYTIGPSGANVTANRPIRIGNAFVRNTSAGDYDTPMVQLTRQQYDLLSPKDVPGVPNSYYYDPARDTGIIYLWPVPNATNYDIHINVQRHIEDITSATQNFDVPQEWFLPLFWNLAAEIGVDYGVTERQMQRIEAKAEYYLKEVADFAVAEEPSVYFQPSPQIGR